MKTKIQRGIVSVGTVHIWVYQTEEVQARASTALPSQALPDVPPASRLYIQQRSQEQYHAMSAQLIQVVSTTIIVRREQVYDVPNCSPQPLLQSTAKKGCLDTTS
jgi:hypothetical protein